jgi:hypothetical protein
MNAKRCVKELRRHCPLSRGLHITESANHVNQESDSVNESTYVHDKPSAPQKRISHARSLTHRRETGIQSFHAPSLISTPEVKVKPLEVDEKENIASMDTLTSFEENEKEKRVKVHQQYRYLHVSETENLTWNSLVENDSCSICNDLLAVPVVTSCSHEYCGICLHRFAKSNYDIYPMDCPLCREPIQRDEPCLDVRRDGFIAGRVDLFVKAQRSHCHGDDWEGKMDYEDWLKRREDYFMSRYTRVELQDTGDIESVGFDEDAELDDFPSLYSDNVGYESVFEGMNSGVMLAIGVAMGAFCCFLLAPSFKQSRSESNLLKEMAIALWR